jgi:hypothetical protein
MKKILVVILIVVIVSLLAFAIPAFAHNPNDESGDTTAQRTWEAMHDACEEGDWQAMVGAAEEVHENFDYALCHDNGYLDSQDGNPEGWGGMMGGHVGGWGSMMEW